MDFQLIKSKFSKNVGEGSPIWFEGDELCFNTGEEIKRYYVNSIQSLVNFMRDHFVPAVYGGELPDNNVCAVYGMLMFIVNEYMTTLQKYINLPIDENGMPASSSYTQWLKLTIESIDIIDNLSKIRGTWSSVYSISGLKEGEYWGPKVQLLYDGAINWGDGTYSSVSGKDEVQHTYNADGNYTITIKSTLLGQCEYTGEGGSVADSSLLKIVKTPFEVTPTE